MSTFAILGVIVIVWLMSKLANVGKRGDSLPPGPPTLPLLGNLHLLPRQFAHLKFTEWARIYGGIISLKIANATLIVISDMDHAKELLDTNSNETSARPPLYAANKVAGGNYLVMADSDSHLWRVGRRAIQPLLAPLAVTKHLPTSTAEVGQLLYDIMQTPEDFYSHISRFTLSFIVSVVHGRRVPHHDSPLANLFHRYIRSLSETFAPDAPPVDFLPILRWIPETFAPWKQLWRSTRILQRQFFFGLMNDVEKRLSSGAKADCYMESLLDRREQLELSREAVGYLGGVLIDGGAETSASLLLSLVLCLMTSSTPLLKAQAEIDRVVGSDRFPDMDDFQSLPYVQAVIKETHRLRPVGPTGVPHAFTKEVKYRGYTIPARTPVFLNIWGIFHDEDVFERPNEFWPERYLLTPNGTRPGIDSKSFRASLPFGSGKRICPGMHLANSNIALATMNLLWAFNFSPVRNIEGSGSTKIDAYKYNEGLTSSPQPFPCRIVPRDEARAQMIEQRYLDLLPLFERYDKSPAPVEI